MACFQVSPFQIPAQPIPICVLFGSYWPTATHFVADGQLTAFKTSDRPACNAGRLAIVQALPFQVSASALVLLPCGLSATY